MVLKQFVYRTVLSCTSKEVYYVMIFMCYIKTWLSAFKKHKAIKKNVTVKIAKEITYAKELQRSFQTPKVLNFLLFNITLIKV